MHLRNKFSPSALGKIAWIYPISASAILLLGAGLYKWDQALYFGLLRFWAAKPFFYPFFDTEYLTALISCWGRGIDVYVTNPCDAMGRLHDYSPIWLRLSFLALDHRWTPILGLVHDALFIASLGALPRSRTWSGTLIMLAALSSPYFVFALERANVDNLIFALSVIAVICLGGRLTTRFAGYGLVLTAACLKFYPLTLLAFLRREPRRAVSLAILAGTALGTFGFVWLYASELAPSFANIPHPSPFGDGFGSNQLPEGLATILHRETLVWKLRCVFTAASILVGARISRISSFQRSLALLARPERAYLVSGALLTAGCFLAGPSVGYRGIFLLLTLPGLQALHVAGTEPRVRKLATISVATSLGSMWILMPLGFVEPHGPYPFAPAFLLLWLLREAMWWILVTLLLAFIAAWLVGRPEFERFTVSREKSPPAYAVAPSAPG